jgi:hypothetical protein
MTRLATVRWARGAAHVLRVIEFNVEAFIEFGRKRFEWRRSSLHIAMANNAHRHIRSYELRKVAFCAGIVTRKFWRRRIVVAASMAGSTCERGVSLAGVDES